MTNVALLPDKAFPCLTLGDGTVWSFIPTNEYLRFWINQMSRLLNLEELSLPASRKIIFTTDKLQKNNIDDIIFYFSKFYPELPKKNWCIKERGIVKYITHYNSSFVICDIGSEYSTVNNLIRIERFFNLIYEHTIQFGGFPVHGALLKKDGIGIIIGAPGGTGKSTCCKRMPEPWYALCDDLSLIVMEKSNIYRVHPLPTWKDSLKGIKTTWNIKENLPLKAIFLLEQADKDRVVPVKKSLGALRLTHLALQICQASWKYLNSGEIREIRENLFSNAWELTSTVPCYTLCCSRTGKFWEEIEKVI